MVKHVLTALFAHNLSDSIYTADNEQFTAVGSFESVCHLYNLSVRAVTCVSLALGT